MGDTGFKKSIDKILEWVLFILMTLLVLDVLWQVFSRYVVKDPSSFTDELAGFLLIWVGLMGTAYVSGQREHLAIDILIQRSSTVLRKKLLYSIEIITALFSLVVLVIGGGWLVYTRYILEVKSAALGLPLYWVYMVLPISGALMLYYAIYSMANKSVIETAAQ